MQGDTVPGRDVADGGDEKLLNFLNKKKWPITSALQRNQWLKLRSEVFGIVSNFSIPPGLFRQFFWRTSL
jgi:hypothetical protein